MKILPQLTQRQCKQFTTQDLSERLDLEITYTKSMLQVLCAKNLVRKELHYSCPQCHSQNVFVCDGFAASYQCYHCQAILEPERVENEIIPFRPVVVEQSEENVAPVIGDDKVEMVEDKDEKTDNDLEKRVVSLENDKKGKSLFWAMVKIIVWVTFMILASWFVLYEMLDIFVFKDQHAFLYEMFMFAMKGSVIETNDWGGIFITIIGGILTLVVGGIDVLGWKKIHQYYHTIKEELIS